MASPECKTYAEWKEIFSDEGLRIVHHRNYLSKNILEAWDIGLRPISPFLIEMANVLPPEKRLDIKERWVEAMMPLVSPFCLMENSTDEIHPPGFHLFVLKKIK
ncbi:hypothetical protein [Azospirillum doebereinerae]|uniref:Uncharacterized protein n=1 Tax=Azospirillum doebereinerae TaxID=92933 RepID=A0A3S0XLS7_9PROT|nr:hypothetical protein [Azospirillum doebereinerae]RUQ68932.1 hypothetical protein EJ913_17320 [Azospirillum doebereinerae]